MINPFDNFKEPKVRNSDAPTEVFEVPTIIRKEVLDEGMGKLYNLERNGALGVTMPLAETQTPGSETPEIAAQSAQVIDLASRQQTPAEEMAEKAREMAQEAYEKDGFAA